MNIINSIINNYIGTIFNIIIFGCLILLLMNYFNSLNMKRKVKQTLVYAKTSSKKKNFIEKMIEKNKHLNKLANDLDIKISMCGLEITPYDIIQKSFVFAGIGFIIGAFILNPIAMVLFAIIGFSIPIVKINDKVYGQLKKIDKQILKGIQAFLNEYQKTQNIAAILENICPKMEFPIRSEFERLLRRINSGINLKDALNELSSRLNNEWIYLFVNALIMNQENGSEITNVLMRTITKISNKEIVQSERDMETFSGRLLNRMIMFTVPVAFILVMIMRPEAKDLFFHTIQGKMVINGAVALCIVSFMITRFTEKL